MSETYKVTEPVVVPHPDVPGAGLVVHVPGDEIPWQRAIELGLVEPEPATEPEPEPAPEPEVSTAEVRRKPRKTAAPDNATSSDRDTP